MASLPGLGSFPHQQPLGGDPLQERLEITGRGASTIVQPDAPPANVRATTRVTIEFLLRILDSLAALSGHDLLKGWIVTALWTTNVRHLINTSANLTYGSIDVVPPDEVRKPVSVLALSNSLHLPYETVRRYVDVLIKEGLCVRVSGHGVMIPSTAQLNADVAHIRAQLANVSRFVGELRRSGVDVKPYRSVTAIKASSEDELPPNVRAVMRLTTDFFVHSAEMLSRAFDDNFVASVIFTAIWTSNVRHITNSEANLEFGGIDDLPPDSMRRPISVRALSSSLHLPYETVRRACNRLVREGACVRVGAEGLIVPRAVLGEDRFKKTVAALLPRVYRFLADLQRVGYDFGD
jgi:DNA-binding transcriptional regulator YhcF (GntR family)